MKRCSICVIAALMLICSYAGGFYRVEDDQVIFYLDLPDAKQVYFAYSLDEFKLHKVKKKQAGTWEIVVPADMEFRYFFIVDEVVHLPGCDTRETDDFGSQNCIFEPAR